MNEPVSAQGSRVSGDGFCPATLAPGGPEGPAQRPLFERIALVLLPVALLTLLATGLVQASYTQRLFVQTTYYFLMATVVCWAATHVHAARGTRREHVVAWVKENWPGLLAAFVLTVIAWHAIQPGLRMLSDEANLVGTSKNFFSSQTATFTVSGKNYYDSYWDVDVAIDQRPPLFPFLVSLVHSAWGYSYTNAFALNLLVLPAFVVLAYRLAKSVGGETFGVVASILAVAHPIVLICVRSAGFDFLALFFALLVVKSFHDHLHAPTPAKLAMLWMNLCMFAEIRYESALFIPVVVGLLFLFKLVTWSTLRPYAFVYALTPAYLAPRIWQAFLLGSVPPQEPGTVAFSAANFVANTHEYFKPILSPFHAYPAHSATVLALGVVGLVLWSSSHWRDILSIDWKRLRFPTVVLAWMTAQAFIVFTYGWGKAQNPASARLVIAIDVFFSFTAAWAVTRLFGRRKSFIAVMAAVGLLAVQVPAAAQHRLLNRLTQTRESATTWRFFESLHEKRILIVTDRPNHFTIMSYGAMSFEAARHDPMIFEALARRLFYDVYVVQQIGLSTRQPLPGYELWPDRKVEPVFEFQNDANVLVRISRLVR